MAQKNAPERLNLNATQVAAGALASVTSAIVASRFGVGGTLVGAGLASVVSTTGATVYSHVLRRTGSRARGVLEELPRHAQHGIRRADGEQARHELAPHDDDAAPASSTAVATPPPPDPEAEAAPPDQEAEAAPRGGRSRRLPVWAVPVAACVLVFVIALGAISVVEAMTGRPAASWVGGSSPPSGTTVGSLVGGDPVRRPAGTPAPTPISTPASSAPPAAPTQEPGTPSIAQPSAPATSPSQGASPAPSSPPQATPTPIPNNGATPAGGG